MALAAVLGFVLVYAQTLSHQIDGAFDARSVDDLVTNRPIKPTDDDTRDALNILLMGSDRRDGDNADIGGYFAGMRNDTTIIMHISADRSRVELVSIPRDTQVVISDCTLFDGTVVKGWKGDFNIAFANGGSHGNAAAAAACVINTVEDLTGIYIDHYAVIDFSGFVTMVDALGGVPMCIPQAITSTTAKLHLEAGPQILDGETALAYARLRTAQTGGVSGSDLQRISRQQLLLSQMAQTALSKNLLTDVGDLTRFIRAGAESMTMDPTLASASYLVGLAYSLRGIERDQIVFATVPWAYTDDRNNVVLLPKAEQTWEQLRTDTALTAVAEGDDSSAWDRGARQTEAAVSTITGEVAQATTTREVTAANLTYTTVAATIADESPAVSLQPSPAVRSGANALLAECTPSR